MKKLGVFILILVIAPLLAATYGVIHDQFTFTISHEYFTKFKFYQFNLIKQGVEVVFPNPRVQVSIVGLMATWWMGIPIGLLLGLEAVRNKDAKTMFIVAMKSLLLTIFITIVGGIIGSIYAYFFVIDKPIEYFSTWNIPKNIVNLKSYIEVGVIHNFSYVSGVVGLLIALIYSNIQRRRNQ